jgi:hypothetical protein
MSKKKMELYDVDAQLDEFFAKLPSFILILFYSFRKGNILF